MSFSAAARGSCAVVSSSSAAARGSFAAVRCSSAAASWRPCINLYAARARFRVQVDSGCSVVGLGKHLVEDYHNGGRHVREHRDFHARRRGCRARSARDRDRCARRHGHHHHARPCVYLALHRAWHPVCRHAYHARLCGRHPAFRGFCGLRGHGSRPCRAMAVAAPFEANGYCGFEAPCAPRGARSHARAMVAAVRLSSAQADAEVAVVASSQHAKGRHRLAQQATRPCHTL